jgi:hypothetical protein
MFEDEVFTQRTPLLPLQVIWLVVILALIMPLSRLFSGWLSVVVMLPLIAPTPPVRRILNPTNYYHHSIVIVK